MEQRLHLLISAIESFMVENPDVPLHISLSSDFYQKLLESNRSSFNLNYDPPKLLGHSFSIENNSNVEKSHFLITNLTELGIL
jgi:hypothetical protein